MTTALQQCLHCWTSWHHPSLRYMSISSVNNGLTAQEAVARAWAQLQVLTALYSRCRYVHVHFNCVQPANNSNDSNLCLCECVRTNHPVQCRTCWQTLAYRYMGCLPHSACAACAIQCRLRSPTSQPAAAAAAGAWLCHQAGLQASNEQLQRLMSQQISAPHTLPQGTAGAAASKQVSRPVW